MIGCHTDVRGAIVDHAQNGSQDASHGGDLASADIARGRQGEIVPEQLVRAVHQINVQRVPPAKEGIRRNGRALTIEQLSN